MTIQFHSRCPTRRTMSKFKQIDHYRPKTHVSNAGLSATRLIFRPKKNCFRKTIPSLPCPTEFDTYDQPSLQVQSFDDIWDIAQADATQ